MSVSRVNILWNFDLNAKQCTISKDLSSKLNNADFCQLKFISSNDESDVPEDSNLVVHYDVDNQLDETTIELSSKLFNLKQDDLNVDFCYIDNVNDSNLPPIIEKLTLLVSGNLYEALSELDNNKEILEFICRKANIVPKETVLKVNEIVFPNWCQIIKCSPYRQGVVDLSLTNVVLVKDKYEILRQPINHTIADERNKVTTDMISLRCLYGPINDELLISRDNNVSEIDDTLNVFVGFQTLSRLKLASGSYIKMRNSDNVSAFVKIFVLTQPCNYPEGYIYAHPRIMSKFRKKLLVSIKGNISFNSKEIPIAKTLRLKKIGEPLQLQKKYEKLITSQLQNFFLHKQRLLKLNDIIPIVFDSVSAELYNKNNTDSHFITESLNTQVDSIVWFKVDTGNLENNEPIEVDTIFQVKPETKTKLTVQGIVSEKPMTLEVCDYISFYQLQPIFHFDHKIFPYAKTMLEVINSSLRLSESNIPLGTNIILHSTTGSIGKNTLVKYCALYLGLNVVFIDAINIPYALNSLESIAKILGLIKAKIELSITDTDIPTIVCLLHIDMLFKDVDPNQDPTTAKLSNSFEVQFIDILKNYVPSKRKGIIFISTTNNLDKLPTRIRSVFNFEINVPVPTEKQRLELFKYYFSPQVLNYGNPKNIDGTSIVKYSIDDQIDLKKISQQSAGLTPNNIKSIVRRSKGESYQKFPQEKLIWNNNRYIISNEQIHDSINKVRDEFSVSIGAPKIPNVNWEDIGGVDIIKNEIMDTIDLPLRHPELFGRGMKQRSGILFYGPPGTGKTLMAKAIASNFSLNFFSVKGPELLNMYIGESEANVRRVFQKARDAKPCVIFFDEIDSVAPKRGNQGDSGGVMDRIVSQLLAELDGMSSNGDGVFVIGATNRPDLLDDSLLRPGRFDKLLYLGIPDNNAKQLNVLNALTRKFNLDQDVQLSKIAELCPFYYSGADFYALCSDAMLSAMIRIAHEVDTKLLEYNKPRAVKLTLNQWFDKVANPNDTKVTVKMEDFIKAQSHLTPSISQDELNHYLQIKKTFENGSDDK